MARSSKSGGGGGGSSRSYGGRPTVRRAEVVVEEAISAVRSRLLQGLDAILPLVAAAWPLTKAWLQFGAALVAALALMAARSMERGLQSLIRVGSAAFFLLLWCTVASMAMLCGSIFAIGAVAFILLAFFFNIIIAGLGFAAFSLVVALIYGSFWMTLAVLTVGGTLVAVKMFKPAISTALIYSLYSTFMQGGFTALLICWSLACIASDLFGHYIQDKAAAPEVSHGAGGTKHTNGDWRGEDERGGRGEQFWAKPERQRTWADTFPDSDSTSRTDFTPQQEEPSGSGRGRNRQSRGPGRSSSPKTGSFQDTPQSEKHPWSFPGGPWRTDGRKSTFSKENKAKFGGWQKSRSAEGEAAGGGTRGSPPASSSGSFSSFFERFRRANSGPPFSGPGDSVPLSPSGSSEEARHCSSEGVSSSGRGEGELGPEDEVARVLRCEDHYAVFGLERYAEFDPLVVKREYRRKAVLVHPDKHKGNDEACDAFKRLQNAYEVLLEESKRKEYDEELSRHEIAEELRQRFRKAREADGHEKLPPDAKMVACCACGGNHVWKCTTRSKSEARWCQECKDYHPAKEGDGWAEQSSEYILFGIVPTVGPLRAYTLSEGKVYEITEWVECQGMKCTPNTHKPTFASKTGRGPPGTEGTGKGKATSKGHKGSSHPSAHEGMNMNMPYDLDGMTDEEIMEFIAQAMAGGMFDGADPFSDMSQSGGSPRADPQNKKGSARKRRKSRRTQF